MQTEAVAANVECGTRVGHPACGTRVERLRQRIIDAPREVCAERARYLTQSMRANWDLHRSRMARPENVLENMSICIRDDELVVGCRTSKLKGAPLFPENKSKWMEADVSNFGKRALQNVLITEDDRRELAEKILPFWPGRTVEDRLQGLPPDAAAIRMGTLATSWRSHTASAIS
jgi:formate C-acetyltransferase